MSTDEERYEAFMAGQRTTVGNKQMFPTFNYSDLQKSWDRLESLKGTLHYTSVDEEKFGKWLRSASLGMVASAAAEKFSYFEAVMDKLKEKESEAYDLNKQLKLIAEHIQTLPTSQERVALFNKVFKESVGVAKNTFVVLLTSKNVLTDCKYRAAFMYLDFDDAVEASAQHMQKKVNFEINYQYETAIAELNYKIEKACSSI